MAEEKELEGAPEAPRPWPEGQEAWAAEVTRRRKEAGLTKSDLAQLIGVSPASVLNWERGDWLPRPSYKRSVEAALDTARGLKRPELGPAEVRQLRRRLGVNQTQLARLCGRATSSVSHWESGKHRPVGEAAAVLATLATADGTPADCAHRIHRARTARGATLAQVAETVGVAPEEVSSWEAGEEVPGVFELAAVAKACSCRPDFVLGVSDELVVTFPYQEA